VRGTLFRKRAETVLFHATGLSQWQTAEEFHHYHSSRPWPGQHLCWSNLFEISEDWECFRADCPQLQLMTHAAASYLPRSHAIKSAMINEKDCKWNCRYEITCTCVTIFIQTRHIPHKNYVEMLQTAKFNLVNGLMQGDSEGNTPYLATKCVCT